MCTPVRFWEGQGRGMEDAVSRAAAEGQSQAWCGRPGASATPGPGSPSLRSVCAWGSVRPCVGATSRAVAAGPDKPQPPNPLTARGAGAQPSRAPAVVRAGVGGPWCWRQGRARACGRGAPTLIQPLVSHQVCLPVCGVWRPRFCEGLAL